MAKSLDLTLGVRLNIKNSKKEVSKDSLKWKFVEKYSKLFNLGDTVEFYCVKKRNCNN